MDREQLRKNIAFWQERIAEASARWGGAQICAVTKTQSAETVNMAHDAGLSLIGENRVQELLSRIDQFDPDIHIHLIGSLQTNKVKYVIGRVELIQSLDRDALADEISRRATAAGIVMPALIQVNIAREPQKGGIDEDELLPFIRRCAEKPGLSVRGLMAIMPIADDPETIRPYFRRMREWFDRLRDMNIDNTSMDVLSMGMSADCVVAAQEGATMVRLGRNLFGERPHK